MANGDAAAAVGMDLVPGTSDLRKGYDEDNKTRDYLAHHQTSGTHDASATITGVFAEARIPELTKAKVPLAQAAERLAAGGGSLTWDGAAWISNGVLACVGVMAPGAGVRSPATYSTSLSYSDREVYIRADGVMGIPVSSARFKQDITPAEISAADVLALRLVWYRYIEAVEREGDDARTELGLIAEEVHELGLTWLVDYDDEGHPFSLHVQLLSFALLALAQDQAAKLDGLTRTVYDLYADLLTLRTRLDVLEGTNA